MSELEELDEEINIAQSRTEMLNVMKKRLSIDHSIALHRDSVSASDFKAMFAQLERAGMPMDATLKVTAANGHTRLWATWAEEAETGAAK